MLWKTVKILLPSVLIFSVCSTTHADWKTTGGPIGGLGYDVRIHPTDSQKMYLTDNFAGVLISNNGGELWQASNSGILADGVTGVDINIFSLSIDPNNNDIIWAGTKSSGEFGVFKSTDGGETWTRKVDGIDNSYEEAESPDLVFRGFTVQPGDSNVVYAQAELNTGEIGRTFSKVNGRVFKSTDGGDNWSTIWTGDNLARYLIVDPEDTNTLYLSTGIFDVEAANSNCDGSTVEDLGGEGVLKSTDGGVTWENINVGLEDPYIGTLRMHPSNNQVLYAGGVANDACQNANIPSVGGLFRTGNGGENWERVASNVINGPISAVNFSPANPNIIYAGFENAIYVSQDGGETWRGYSKDNGKYGPEGINAGIPIDIVVDTENPNMVFANNYGGGVFRSTDGAQTWQSWSRGFSGAVIDDIEATGDGDIVYTVGLSGAFRSVQYGSDWQGIANGDAGGLFQTFGLAVSNDASPTVLLADKFNGEMYRSTDGGEDFQLVASHEFADDGIEGGFKHIEFAQTDTDIVYAAMASNHTNSSISGDVVYKSENSGASFSALDTGTLLDDLYVYDIHVDPSDANVFYVAAGDLNPGDDDHLGSLYKSVDGGESFFAILPNTNVGTVYTTREGTVVAGSLYTGIYASESAYAATSDTEISWEGPYVTATGSEDFVSDIKQHPTDNILFLAEAFNGVFSSSDGGATWQEYPESGMPGLEKFASNVLAVSEHALYVGTNGGGVFRHALNDEDTSLESISFESQTDVELSADITSNSVLIAGLSTVADISVSDGAYSVNGGSFTSESGLVANDDSVQLLLTSSEDHETETSITVTIGNSQATFSATTMAEATKTEGFVAFDYDGDGMADVGVRRPSNFFQYISNSDDGETQRVQFGKNTGDIPVSGDFDGDGIADVAVRRPSNFFWYIKNSSDGETQRVQFGKQATDIPVPADYDGDGITDIAVRRASNQFWYILNSSDGEIQRINFGKQEEDIPVPADYDGDGIDDVAVRRPSNFTWYIRRSSDGETEAITFGRNSDDIPVPADYDGDGKADVAVRRASNQFFYIRNSSDGETQRYNFGKQSEDIPIVADYDGDGKADVAVRRSSNFFQYILHSSDGEIQRLQFGKQSGDIPLAAPILTKMSMLE